MRVRLVVSGKMNESVLEPADLMEQMQSWLNLVFENQRVTYYGKDICLSGKQQYMANRIVKIYT